MFIGEGPDYYEDLHGRPLVVRAGKLLDRLLALINLVREDVLITNMIKCRHTGNRDPGTAEIACTKYLYREIELINPKLIVPWAGLSLVGISPERASPRPVGNSEKDRRIIFPVQHPAAVLRREELRPTMIKDFKAISEILEGAT